jgi:hypothetical protein
MPRYSGKNYSEKGRRATQHSSGGTTQHAKSEAYPKSRMTLHAKQETAFNEPYSKLIKKLDNDAAAVRSTGSRKKKKY